MKTYNPQSVQKQRFLIYQVRSENKKKKQTKMRRIRNMLTLANTILIL